MWLHKSQHNYQQTDPQVSLVQLKISDEFYRYQFCSDFQLASKKWWCVLLVPDLLRLPLGAVPLVLWRNPLQWPILWCDWCEYRFQSCSDHRWNCSKGSPTRSCCDHLDPYLPSADFWTGTSPVQATGRVSSKPVMSDTDTSSVQTAGCGHTDPARATG